MCIRDSHGAGVESLLRLFDTGFFPCGNGHNVEFWNAICCTVAKDKVNGQEVAPLPSVLSVDFPTAYSNARQYAKLNAETLHYATAFKYKTGVSLSVGIKMYWNMVGGSRHRVMKEDRLKVEKAYAQGITAGATRRKGIVIVFYEEEGIMQLKRKKDRDGDGVYVCRPKGSPGMPASFIGGVKLLGKIEKEIVKEYLLLHR